MPSASVNGISIEYDEHGDADAPPLLLVMGLGGQLVGWPVEFVEQLAAAGPFRVIRYDNRDVGLSTHVDAPPPTIRQQVGAVLSRRLARSAYLLSDMARDGIGLLDHLGIARAHVVGMSMGGMIVQTMAIEHPERVASMTSVMSNTGDRKHGKAKMRLLRKMASFARRRRKGADPIDLGVESFRLISGPHFDEAGLRQMTAEALERSDDVEGTARQLMAIQASPDRTEGLRGVTAPTLVVHGLVDPLVQPDGGMATAQAVPGARLVMYPDMGHDLPRPRWGQMIGEIVETAASAGG
ncbi:MAG: alpha/beta fold hydrolase [Desertimonas sp.]